MAKQLPFDQAFQVQYVNRYSLIAASALALAILLWMIPKICRAFIRSWKARRLARQERIREAAAQATPLNASDIILPFAKNTQETTQIREIKKSEAVQDFLSTTLSKSKSLELTSEPLVESKMSELEERLLSFNRQNSLSEVSIEQDGKGLNFSKLSIDLDLLFDEEKKTDEIKEPK